MSDKKQTALQWLLEQWPILESQLPSSIINQALEMEREQIIEFAKKWEFEVMYNMGRERESFTREHKGDITINIADIFRNEEMQKEAIKGCKKINKLKTK